MNWFFIAFISAVLSAASAISQKKVLFNISALSFSFYVSLFNLILSIPFFFGADYYSLNTETLLILFIKSVLGVFAFLCVMLALKNLEISGALPLMVLTPGLVALFAFLFLGEGLTILEITGMFLLLCGTYILEMKPGQSLFAPFKVYSNSRFHYFIGLAILLFTASSILDKLLLGRYKLEPFTFMAFQQLFFAVIFSLIYFIRRKDKRNNSPDFNINIFIWIFIISILTVGYRYTQIEAVKIAPVALVLSVKRISVFIAAALGGKIFKEKNLLIKVSAAAVMVLGAIMIFED